LNTTVIDLFFPGMVAKYGANKQIDISTEVRALNNLTAKEGDKTISLEADVGVQF